MDVRFINSEEAVDYLKISAASFIWKFDKEVDKEVEMPVLGAFNDGKLIAGVEVKNNADDFFRAFPHHATLFIDSFWSI